MNETLEQEQQATGDAVLAMAKSLWSHQASLRIKVLSNRRVGHHPELTAYRQGLWAILPRNTEYFL